MKNRNGKNNMILLEGKKMENYIICPNCKKTISNEPIIDAAAKKEDYKSRFLTCECGESITYWVITAQLRKQKTLGGKIRNWLRPVSQEQS